MSAKNKKLSLPSLAQHFNAPDDYLGHFGWLCGYSADALFMNDAAERFTQVTEGKRASAGSVSLALMLDPGNPKIRILDAPGVAHLLFKRDEKIPFKLLHAKVALLGFRHREDSSQWHLRLLVSTGNWTRQTLEESLDLAWRIDISSESLRKPTKETLHNCSDIKAAHQFFEWLQKYFDTSLLIARSERHKSETGQAVLNVKRWIDICTEKAEGNPRFFDNRKKSLLSQLSGKIKETSGTKRNYLAMGSGFYETANNTKKPPQVPMKIIDSLRKEGLLTKKAKLEIYVNPNGCQSVASSLGALNEQGISVYPARIPEAIFGKDSQRTLHAKFLFSANYRQNVCSSPWVYLGSGNLTNPGFANSMSSNNGNLEAGVVFSPEGLYWNEEKDVPNNKVIRNLLPILTEGPIENVAELASGSDMEQREEVHVAPPVTWLRWHTGIDIAELRVGDHTPADIEVLDSSGTACEKTETGFRWVEEQRPREVCIRWQDKGKSFEERVPVVDEFGRIAAAELVAMDDINEAWWQLVSFPMALDVDDDFDDGDNVNDTAKRSGQQINSSQVSSYPVRQMMEIIENIAIKQTAINKLDWNSWCSRLEQILGQAKDSAQAKYFRQNLKINPLIPLRHAAFRPPFAENNDSKHGELYEGVLNRVEENWQVVNLTKLELRNGA